MFEIFREDIERDIEENKHTINKETSSFFTRKIHPPKWIPRRSCKLIRNTDRSSNNNKNKINEPIQHHHLRLSLSHELAPSPLANVSRRLSRFSLHSQHGAKRCKTV